jgi:hypothetical protein
MISLFPSHLVELSTESFAHEIKNQMTIKMRISFHNLCPQELLSRVANGRWSSALQMDGKGEHTRRGGHKLALEIVVMQLISFRCFHLGRRV